MPGLTPIATPPEPIAAIPGAELVQVTSDVRSCVVPSAYMPVAINCSPVPWAIAAEDGLTCKLVKTAVTLSVTGGDVIPPTEAVI